MRRAILVALTLFCFVVDEGAAQFRNGNELFQDCEGGDDPQQKQTGDPGGQWGMCLGFILGVADALHFCIPTGVNSGQVKDVVTLYLRDHPEQRHLPASDLVTAAIKEKFPCN